MEKEKTIDALNTLVEINNDRIEGYKKASENTDERDLKDLFSNFIKTSRNCRHELVSEINKLGGKATDETNTSGKFFRAWMDFKSSLTGRDRKAILNSCEYGEKHADRTYQNVLDDESEHLNREQFATIKAQHKLLNTDYSKIKTMQNALVAAS
jgi:uncharacterized protein (TIGR02284 family)